MRKAQLAGAMRRLLDEGYSMTDLGRELGITRQAVNDLLRWPEQGSGK
jgi:predicted transcriptional regulator